MAVSIWPLGLECWHLLSPDLPLKGKGPEPWLTWMRSSPLRERMMRSDNPTVEEADASFGRFLPAIVISQGTYMCSSPHITALWMRHAGPIILRGRRSLTNVTTCVSQRQADDGWIFRGHLQVFLLVIQGNKHVLGLQMALWNKAPHRWGVNPVESRSSGVWGIFFFSLELTQHNNLFTFSTFSLGILSVSCRCWQQMLFF